MGSNECELSEVDDAASEEFKLGLDPDSAGSGQKRVIEI